MATSGSGVLGADDVALQEIRTRVTKCPATQALKDHTQEFEKKVYTVTAGVHVAVGFALANSILIEAPEGLIVVDTTESTASMGEIWAEFRKISDKPLKGVIYTHSHEDHIGGTAAIVEGAGIEIWAHKKFLDIKDTYDSLLRGVMMPRNMRQFGMPLDRMGALHNCGIGPRVDPHFKPHGLHWPTRLMEGESSQDITLAGLDLQLVYIPGETLCQMGVWIPSKRVFLPGDNFYRAFPNLYAIRGTVPRIITCWIRSLDIVRRLQPDFLVPSHSRPLSGQNQIYDAITSYRDAIQFVHDQTLRLMNKGLHPIEVARSIQLPRSLQQVPFLQSFYGTPEWSSRAVYDAYVGWFSGTPEDLFPLTPGDRGKKMTEAFGADKVLEVAESALGKGDLQWALELSSYVLHAVPDAKKAKNIRTRAILGLAENQVSANGRNYLLTYLLEDHGAAPRRYPSANAVLGMPVELVFKRMALVVKAEELEDVVMTVVVTFTDLQNKTYSLHVRNCVLEFEEKACHERDLAVSTKSDCLRHVMAGQSTAQQLLEDGKLTIDDGGPVDVLIRFFSCFETGDECLQEKEE